VKVGIVGLGWVGRAMQAMFPNAVIRDTAIERSASMAEINACDVAFIAVPTPNRGNGSLDTGIVEEVLRGCDCPLIVIRSTVNPGFTDEMVSLHGKRIVFQPEYLGETPKHPMSDMGSRPFMILGGEPKARRAAIDVYSTVMNANVSIRQMSALEAEVVKLSENRAIAFKVAQCQELYDACEKAGVDYYAVRDAVYGDDPRFDLWWTLIYPDKRGMNSKCIPKDVLAWNAWAEGSGYNPVITKAILERNKEWVC
jgi:UDPglucose 6-dehydrogenase